MDTTKEELIQLIRNVGYKYSETPFTLSSGDESQHYIDIKSVALDPLGARLIASQLVNKMIRSHHPDFIGGPEIGAVPIIGATLALYPHPLSNTLPKGFIVRKETRKHGVQSVFAGTPPTKGSWVVLIEDVLTTGRSVGKVVELVRGTGANILKVYCVVDRGGKGPLEATYGVNVEALCTLSEIVGDEHNGCHPKT